MNTIEKLAEKVEHEKIKKGLRTLKRLGRAEKLHKRWVDLAWESLDRTNIVPTKIFAQLVEQVIEEKNL